MCLFCKREKIFGMTFITINNQPLSWCQDCEHKIMFEAYQNLNIKRTIKF